MKNNMKITLNGQSFEVPVDMSVLTGFMASVPRPVQQVEQSSHRRLEEDFFNLIRKDMNTFRRFNQFGREERILRSIVALHNRLRRLEDCCDIKGTSVAQQATKPKLDEKVAEANPNLAEFVKVLMKNIKPFVQQKTEQEAPEQEEVAKKKVIKKPEKPKPKTKPKSIAKPTKIGKVTKKKS